MEKKILEVFLYNDRLKFNEIEKLTKLRSNVLAYYLKNFEENNVIVKKDGKYFLSSESEYMIPYVSDKQAMLPTVLIMIGNGNGFFLPFRKKKPYKGFLGMPAGRLLVGENIKEAVKRIMWNKHGINSRFKHVNSVSIEHIKKNGKIVHSFVQILITASTKNDIEYLDIEENKNKLIKSDYLFLKKHFDLRYDLKTINSKE